MKWVTREQVGVDRMGCAWLIRRWIDPEAEFVFVPRDSGPLPADAEPFDMPGARFSHRGGHCTFLTLLDEYRLNDPVLRRLGRIVDEADTIQEVALEPASPGLDLICDGIRESCTDDVNALERGAMVYEALYAAVAATRNKE